MSKLLRHKWIMATEKGHYHYFCEKCKCIRYYDMNYQSTMYSWGTHITYRPPKCILLSSQKPYNL